MYASDAYPIEYSAGLEYQIAFTLALAEQHAEAEALRLTLLVQTGSQLGDGAGYPSRRGSGRRVCAPWITPRTVVPTCGRG